MRKLIIVLLLLPFLAQAQEESESSEATQTPAAVSKTGKPSTRSLSYWSVGVSLLQWNEALRLEQAGGSATDVANFSGTGITLERSTYFYRWGYSLAGLIASGRANGGGTSSVITYDETKLPWTMFGFMPRAYYRMTGRINFGATVPVTYKNITWPETGGITADSGKKLNIFALLDMNLRLTNNFDLYQGIGPIGNGTFWQFGLSYRL